MQPTPHTVLIVEDDRSSLLALKMRLEFHGWRVITAGRGSDAVDAARAERPDVILLDLGLPDVDGTATIRLFTRDPALRAIPVVVLSGQNEASHRGPSLEAGASAYLEKPADVAEVLSALQDALSAV